MKYEQVKATSEELAAKIFDYIHDTDLSDDEKDNLFRELACSFVTASVHDNSVIDAMINISDICYNMRSVCAKGYAKFLDGKANVLSDRSDG